MNTIRKATSRIFTFSEDVLQSLLLEHLKAAGHKIESDLAVLKVVRKVKNRKTIHYVELHTMELEEIDGLSWKSFNPTNGGRNSQ